MIAKGRSKDLVLFNQALNLGIPIKWTDIDRVDF